MKFGRWVLVIRRILAIPAIAVVVLLHYDTSLWHRLTSVKVGEVTVAAAISVIGVVYAAWTGVDGFLDLLKNRLVKTYESAHEEKESKLKAAAADLGEKLRAAADREIGNRGLKSPEPLPVHWRRVVTTGPDGKPVQGHGPEGVYALSRIARQVRQSDLPRIVLIGEPGSGKTAVTLFLQRDLIDSDPASPIPLALPLSTWNLDVELLDWAAARLEERFPAFSKPLSVEDDTESVARRLIRDRRVRLILDALDELPKGLLAKVFSKINEEGSDFPVIVTCRTADYEQASRTAGAAGESCELKNARVFELYPPKVAEVRNYLGDTQEKGRWDSVFAWLQPGDGPLAQVLSIPLMTWLARRVYQDAHPNRFAELLERGELDSPDAIKNHLLDGFIPAVYGNEREARRARTRFAFIAEHLTARTESGYSARSGKGLVQMGDDDQNIAWWRWVSDDRARLTDRLLLIAVGGLIPGGCVGLGWTTATWNWLPHPAPLVSGLTLGVVCTAFMALGCLRNDPPPTGTQFSRPGNFKVSAIVMGFAFFVGSAAALAMSGDLINALYSLVVALPVALAYTFTNPYVDADRVSTPLKHYRADIQQTVLYAVAYGLGVGILVAIYRSWPLSLALGLMAGVAGGFTYGAVYKIAYGEMPSGMVAWVRFRVAHLRLALTGKLPWRYFGYLEDAHRRGVLRQTGPNYQFSHSMLRDHLAHKPIEAVKAGRQVTG